MDTENRDVNESSSSLWAIWHWNGTVTEKTILRRFSELAEAGFPGIILRPMLSMNPSYMSEEFLQRFKYLLTLCEQSNIRLMIGDDFSEPAESIFAASVHQTKNFRAGNLNVSETFRLSENEEFHFIPDPERDEYAAAAPLISGNRISLDGIVSIYDGSEELACSWTAPAGNWLVMRFTVTPVRNDEGRFIPNFFSIKCAQSYINSVLEPLAAVQGEQLSPAFCGVFCEMPPLVPSRAGIPWDHELFLNKYRSRFKRNLLTTLPALFFPCADSDAKYRPHVLNFLHDTLFERFPSVIQKWAASKNLAHWFIGAESDFLDLTSSVAPLFSLANSGFTVTGIRNDTNSPLSEAAVITTASLNREQYNRGTAVVINRSCAMKSVTIAEMKREADLAVLDGADHIAADGFYLSQSYHFSRTTPPSITAGHPDFVHLAETVRAIRNTLAAAAHRVTAPFKAVLLYPSQSAMADYCACSPEVIPYVTSIFLSVINELHSAQIPFAIMTEQDVVDFDTDTDAVLMNRTTGALYSGIIVPYARLINNSLFVLIEKYAVRKGTVLFINESPHGSFDDPAGHAFAQRLERILGSRRKYVYHIQPDELSVYLPQYEPYAVFCPEQRLNGVRICTSESDGSRTVIIQNRGDQPIQGTLTRLNNQPYSRFDPVLETVESGDTLTEENFFCTVYPGETALFASGIETCRQPQSTPENLLKIKLTKRTFTARSINSFPLTRWNCRMGIDRTAALLSASYETFFEISAAVPESYLVLSNPALPDADYRIRVNGTEVTPLNNHEFRRLPIYADADPAVCIFALTDFLVQGTNSVRFIRHAVGNSPDPLAYPLMIYIDSPVEQTGKGWRTISHGDSEQFSWGGKGYPYLTGEGEYRFTFDLLHRFRRVVLSIESLSGSVDISLNGTVYPTLLFPPYRIDITEAVQENQNTLVLLVRSSLDVLTSLTGDRSGILGDLFLELT